MTDASHASTVLIRVRYYLGTLLNLPMWCYMFLTCCYRFTPQSNKAKHCIMYSYLDVSNILGKQGGRVDRGEGYASRRGWITSMYPTCRGTSVIRGPQPAPFRYPLSIVRVRFIMRRMQRYPEVGMVAIEGFGRSMEDYSNGDP